jgi:hypothetical protein
MQGRISIQGRAAADTFPKAPKNSPTRAIMPILRDLSRPNAFASFREGSPRN